MTSEKQYDRLTVVVELPVDRTADEVRAALLALGARRVDFYAPRPSTSRPMHGGYPE